MFQGLGFRVQSLSVSGSANEVGKAHYKAYRIN